ncbi:MAG: type II secretion system protein [Vicinamibacterales bacterium]
MHLEGQRGRGTIGSEAGFALAAMLVAIAILSVMLTVALPTWRHQVMREKEAELVFRGEQYARAIGLFQRRFGGAFPPNLDVLVEQKFLRKKYKDPITGEDFVPVYGNSPEGMSALRQRGFVAEVSGRGTPPGRGRAQVQVPGPPPGRGRAQVQPPGQPPGGGRGQGQPSGGGVRIESRQIQGRVEMRIVQAEVRAVGPGLVTGIVGVVSKSKDQSIRLYNGLDHYNQWIFVSTVTSPQPGPPRPPGTPPPPPPPGRGRGRGQ